MLQETGRTMEGWKPDVAPARRRTRQSGLADSGRGVYGTLG